MGYTESMLQSALRLVPAVKYLVQYQYLNGEIKDATGKFVPQYSPAESLGICSVQPFPRGLYAEYQLDMQKNYQHVYALKNMLALENKPTPDRLIFDGKIWNVINTEKWINYSDFNKVLVCEDKKYVQI